MTSAQHVNLIGQPVRSLQTMLRELSYHYSFLPRLTPDGVFGERTLEAVMLFQRELHPPVTGRVDQGVWDAIAEQYLDVLSHTAPPLPLRGFPAGGHSAAPGEESLHLALAQTMLRGLARTFPALEPPPADGVNGPATAGGLRWVQKASGLPQTGALDQPSWNALSRLYTLFVTLGA